MFQSQYLTLPEAAAYATENGVPVVAADLLRAGTHRALLICAAFNSKMRNLVRHRDEDYLGLLVISAGDLLNIETHGQAQIQGAFSLNGDTVYAPLVTRTTDQLRVTVVHLDKFLATAQGADAPPDNAGARAGITKQEVIAAFDELHFVSAARWSRALATPPEWLVPCRVTKGRRGNRLVSATWNPALIAVALFDKRVSIRKLETVFVGLADWAEEWREKSSSLRE